MIVACGRVDVVVYGSSWLFTICRHRCVLAACTSRLSLIATLRPASFFAKASAKTPGSAISSWPTFPIGLLRKPTRSAWCSKASRLRPRRCLGSRSFAGQWLRINANTFLRSQWAGCGLFIEMVFWTPRATDRTAQLPFPAPSSRALPCAPAASMIMMHLLSKKSRAEHF